MIKLANVLMSYHDGVLQINKLAAVRINGMVERLQLSQQIRESVYRLFQHVLAQRTSLLFNRHIDQIILCCFYGVAKISQMSLTFREIIYNYRKQPQCKPLVFRSVYVDSHQSRRQGQWRVGPDHVDIITFYNEIFIPAVKPLLVEIIPVKKDQAMEANNKAEGHCPGSPKVSVFPSVPDMSPKKVSAVHNVYVSPLRGSKMDALVSHSSKSYYACVGESTHAYQSPSKDLSAINNRLNNCSTNRKRTLKFDVEAGLVSDSMVGNSLYLQNQNMAAPFTLRKIGVPPNSANLTEARRRVFDFFRAACRSLPTVMDIYNLQDVVAPSQLRFAISAQIRNNAHVTDPKAFPLISLSLVIDLLLFKGMEELTDIVDHAKQRHHIIGQYVVGEGLVQNTGSKDRGKSDFLKNFYTSNYF
ncbi:hypothetical protein F2Q68_00017879 [Brassica cretica]|uniref:Retinoblastoma-associated protein B-box domain-containing protein n=3 Tax=Brassica TaxID=3705 RepID=A0A8S9HGY0_BRACR|nr:hypothetical protein F2Q68_00017879 [Brassica cretica]